MFEVQGKLIHAELLEKKFVCDLKTCKGACCVEGDSGAPLDPDEVQWLEAHYLDLLPYLDAEGRSIVQQSRAQVHAVHGEVTPLKSDQACIYSTRNELGILQCGIEQAYLSGRTDFIKPISCHLYPIRVSKDPAVSWEALNYDRWDICNPACNLGEKLKIPVYQFLKTALIRKYGESFYKELEELATQWSTRDENNSLTHN